VSRYQNVAILDFIGAMDDGGGGGGCQLELQDFQSSSQTITTNRSTPSFFTDRMTFLSPNQRCQSTQGEVAGTSMHMKSQKVSGCLSYISCTNGVAVRLLTNMFFFPYQSTEWPMVSKSP